MPTGTRSPTVSLYVMAREHAAIGRNLPSRGHPSRRSGAASRRGPSPLTVIAGLVVLATVLVMSAAWLVARLGEPAAKTLPAAPQIASEAVPAAGAAVDPKSKGSVTAPVLVEEWGDFQ